LSAAHCIIAARTSSASVRPAKPYTRSGLAHRVGLEVALGHVDEARLAERVASGQTLAHALGQCSSNPRRRRRRATTTVCAFRRDAATTLQ